MTGAAPTQRRTLARTLTRRLLWIAGVVTLANVAFVAAQYSRDTEGLQIEVVGREMARLEAALLAAPPGAPAIGAEAAGLYRDHPDAYAYALLDASGRIIEAANPALIPAEARDTGMFADDWLSRRPGPDGPVLIASHVAPLEAEPARIVFVMADDPAGLMREALLREFATHIWLPLLPIALLLIGASALMIRSGLAPLSRAAAWARTVRPGDPPPAFALDGQPAEVADLAEAVGRMAERLNAALDAEKRRAAEAAHALRTPLAVLIARLDAHAPGAERDQLAADLAAMQRMVTQLLASSRAAALVPSDTAAVDLAPLAEAVVAGLAPMAVARGVELGLEVAEGGVRVNGVAGAVELALANLVENAILHGGRRVEVEVGPGPSLTVRDDGPGFPTEVGARAFEPFWRGPNAPEGGAGLGLAIVERVQRAHGGGVDVRLRPEGGSELRITYRPAQPA
jgi:two-component system OmpR family sensor kinase